MNGGRFCQPQTSMLPFFCLDYDANICTPNKGTIEMRDMVLSLTKAWKGIALRWATVGQSEMHRPAITVTWIMHNPLCPDFRKWCGSVPTPPHLFQHRLKLLFMCQRSCRETISHIRTLKLIERDAGDKEREQRQLFVTSLHLTGIIRYMKLKFHTGGSCWQHGFLFCSLPPFFLLCSCLC